MPPTSVSMSRFLLILGGLALVACGPTRGRGGGGGGGGDGGNVGPDSDGDGLSDSFEASIGTNANEIDTDGDGFDDYEEHTQYFLARDDTDWPYLGDYPRGPLPEDVGGQGWDEGDVTNDWTREDQHGQELSLHRFYGNVVLISLGAEWCGPCQAAAPQIEDGYQDRRSRGFVPIELLLDGLTQGSPPDLERWADAFDLQVPVISDFEGELTPHYIESNDGSFGIPAYTVLDRELRVVAIYENPVPWDLIDDLLDEPAPEVDWPLPFPADDGEE